MFPVTESAKLMSNEENAPPGCAFAWSAGTGINVGTGITTSSATAGRAAAAIAITTASPKVGTWSDLKIMCLSPIVSYSLERRRDRTHLNRTAVVDLLGVPPLVQNYVPFVQNYALDRRKSQSTSEINL